MVFQELSGPWGRLDQEGVEITPKNVGFLIRTIIKPLMNYQAKNEKVIAETVKRISEWIMAKWIENFSNTDS